jgi:hypothetical protein
MKAWLVASALLGLACAAHAQSTVKCQDRNGRIVYVDRDCAVYGLQEIGPVKDRMTVAPAKPSAESEDRAPAPDAQRGMQACRVDAQKFCRDVKPGGGAMMDCLIDHQDDISEDRYQLLKAKLQSGK